MAPSSDFDCARPSPEPPEFLTLQGYEIIHEISRGAQGIVYKARHCKLGRNVAIKVRRPGVSRDRFNREARIVASLKSPYIPIVYDYTVLDDERPVMVIEWIDGEDLSQVIRQSRQPLAETKVQRWMIDVARGMKLAAGEGIVHRDLKPSNILINKTEEALVADFGLARCDALHVDDLSATQGVIGTPYYMAPEQAEDPRSVDTRTDIYSYGATFYHALTKVPPFEGPSCFAVLQKHKNEPLVPPRARNDRITEQTNGIIERCLAKAITDRFQSFSELLSMIESERSDPPWRAQQLDARLTPHFQRFESLRSGYLRRGVGENDTFTFPNGRILTIVREWIEEQNVDALVSSDDDALSMSGGASAAILRAGGASIKQEAQRFAPVLPGRVVVTSAGRLSARFVFHAVTIGTASSGSEWVLPSPDIINSVIRSCFYQAETLKTQSIAFPLVGTGLGGFSRETCLDMLFRALANAFMRELTPIREARIVLGRAKDPDRWYRNLYASH